MPDVVAIFCCKQDVGNNQVQIVLGGRFLFLGLVELEPHVDPPIYADLWRGRILEGHPWNTLFKTIPPR